MEADARSPALKREVTVEEEGGQVTEMEREILLHFCIKSSALSVGSISGTESSN